jgi:hypothetical protein
VRWITSKVLDAFFFIPKRLLWILLAVKGPWKTLNNVLLPESKRLGIVGNHMNTVSDSVDCRLQARFCLRFQRLLRELTQRGYPLAEGFGPAWEAAMEDVPLEEAVHGPVYRRLIAWAGAERLFTSAPSSGPSRERGVVLSN